MTTWKAIKLAVVALSIASILGLGPVTVSTAEAQTKYNEDYCFPVCPDPRP